jgi:hypothetical protein
MSIFWRISNKFYYSKFFNVHKIEKSIFFIRNIKILSTKIKTGCGVNRAKISINVIKIDF